MQKLIKDNAIVDDNWVLIEGDDAAPADRPAVLPLARWLALPDDRRTGGNTAPWIDSGEEFEEHLETLKQAPMIVLNFPAFMDGRNFSAAEVLRREGFEGELRAVGYLIQDQLFFLKRCGFDSVQLREGTDLEAALASLKDFSVNYQTSADTEQPLFRRR